MNKSICGLQDVCYTQCLLDICHFLTTSNHFLFIGFSVARLHKDIKEAKFNMSDDPWPTISDCAKDLILKLITIDPEVRLSPDEALNHEWIVKKRHTSCDLIGVTQRMSVLKSYRQQANIRFSDNYYPRVDIDKLCERKSLLFKEVA